MFLRLSPLVYMNIIISILYNIIEILYNIIEILYNIIEILCDF